MLIKSLMNVLKDSIIRDATTLPLKENLVLRFERRGAARNKYNENRHCQDRKPI
jgi:hypothetical protein